MRDRVHESTSQRANAGRTPRPALVCFSALLLFPAFLLLSLVPLDRALAATPPPKAAVPLALRWEPGTYHLGDLVPFEISVSVPSKEFYIDGELTEGADWGDAVIAKVRQDPPAGYPGTLVVRGEVQAFEVGSVSLPPLVFNLHLSDTVQPYSIKAPPLPIAALLSPGQQARPAIAAPLAIPAPWPWPWIAASLVLTALLTLGAFLFYRKARGRSLQPRAAPEPKEVDPDRWIREEVERIFREPAEAPARYQRLSETLREYMSIKFERPFLEWTTSEVARGLKEIEGFTGVPLKDSMNLFAFCDVVMFARYAPLPQEEKDAREIALDLIHAIQRPRELEAAS